MGMHSQGYRAKFHANQQAVSAHIPARVRNQSLPPPPASKSDKFSSLASNSSSFDVAAFEGAARIDNFYAAISLRSSGRGISGTEMKGEENSSVATLKKSEEKKAYQELPIEKHR